MNELEQMLRRIVREELEAHDRRRATAAPPDVDEFAERAIQHVAKVRAAGARRARNRRGGS